MSLALASCQRIVGAGSCSRATSELLFFNLFTALISSICAFWKCCALASASMFLGLRHVTVLLLCNLATLQCYSCSTTKRCRPSPFQRRAQNVNHPRHRCDFGKWLYLIDRSHCGNININDNACSRIVPK